MKRREALKVAGAAIAAAGLGGAVQAEMIDAAVAGMIIRCPAGIKESHRNMLAQCFSDAFQSGAITVPVLIVPDGFEVETLSAEQWKRLGLSTSIPTN